MRIQLIRHGSTMANEQHLYCGSTDLSISDAGALALQNLRAQGLYTKPELIFTSGLLRTQQTAHTIFETTAFRCMPALNEIDFGAFELRSYEQLKQNPAYLDWINHIDTAPPPGGEAKPDFTLRVVNGLKEMLSICKAKKANCVAVVTHGGVIATWMELFLPKTKSFYEWQPTFGKGYVLHFSDSFITINYTTI